LNYAEENKFSLACIQKKLELLFNLFNLIKFTFLHVTFIVNVA